MGVGEGERHCQTAALIKRLRTWTHAVDAVPASDLMDEAAKELDRLLGVIDAYADSAAAACREINMHRETISRLRRDGREFYD